MFIKIGHQLVNLAALASVNLDDGGDIVLCPAAAVEGGEPTTALRFDRGGEQGRRLLEFFATAMIDRWGPGALDLTARGGGVNPSTS